MCVILGVLTEPDGLYLSVCVTLCVLTEPDGLYLSVCVTLCVLTEPIRLYLSVLPCVSIQSLVELMGNAIQPLLGSISDALEAIILTMHNEDFSM